MKIQPVISPKNPEYPSIEKYISQPAGLLESVPFSWSRKKLVSYMLASFVLSGSVNGCHTFPPIKYPSKVIDINPNNNETQIKESPRQGLIAPVFAHGEGSGAVGCVAVASPVFISEDEAMKIIADAFRAEGLELFIGAKEVKYSRVDPYNDPMNPVEKEDYVKFDGYCDTLNLVVEFISRSELGVYTEYQSVSGGFYNTRKAAELMRQTLDGQVKDNIAIFYDPLVYHGHSRKNNLNEDEALEQSKLLLLDQVNDFIDWMKKKGIIR